MKYVWNYCIFILILLFNVKTQISLSGLSGFKCYGVTKVHTPIRITPDNQIECFSLDGITCVDYLNTDRKCRSFVKANIHKLQPLTCTKDSTEKWCIQARKFFYKNWQCSDVSGLQTGIRINESTGDVECLSFNGRDCVWGDYGEQMCKKIKTCKKTQANAKPLTCGNHHNQVYGSSGYLYSKSHWCKVGYGFFFYTGRWLCKRQTGISTLVRVGRDGEIECAAYDGRNCIWGVNKEDSCMDLIKRANQFRPLKCGETHKHYYGGSGYFNKNHWCRKSFDLFYQKRMNTFGPKISKLPSNHPYVNSNPIKSKLDLESRIKNTKFWKYLKKWAPKSKVNLNSFWKKLLAEKTEKVIKKTKWWKKFKRFTNKNKFNFPKHFREFRDLLEKLKNGLNKTKIPFNKFIKNKWEDLIKAIKAHKLWKLLVKFFKQKKISQSKFIKKVLKIGWEKATKSSSWWPWFLKWLKNRKFKNLPKTIKKFVKHVSIWKKKIRKVWKNLKPTVQRSRTRGRRNVIRKKPKNVLDWFKDSKPKSNSEFYKIISKYCNIRNKQIRQFWSYVKRFGFKEGVKRLDWWDSLKNCAQKKGFNLNSLFKGLKAKVDTLAKEKKKKSRINDKKWRFFKERILRSRIWDLFTKWARIFNKNIDAFLKKIRNSSWKEAKK